MTIKPLVNQKTSGDDSQEGTSQNLANNGTAVRATHRNVVLNQLTSESQVRNLPDLEWSELTEGTVFFSFSLQPLPREKRVHTPHSFDNESVRHRRSPHKK